MLFGCRGLRLTGSVDRSWAGAVAGARATGTSNNTTSTAAAGAGRQRKNLTAPEHGDRGSRAPATSASRACSTAASAALRLLQPIAKHDIGREHPLLRSRCSRLRACRTWRNR